MPQQQFKKDLLAKVDNVGKSSGMWLGRVASLPLQLGLCGLGRAEPMTAPIAAPSRATPTSMRVTVRFSADWLPTVRHSKSSRAHEYARM